MGNEAAEPAPDAGEPETIPPGGAPGILGDRVAELWFKPLGGTPALVQIGEGAEGTPDYSSDNQRDCANI